MKHTKHTHQEEPSPPQQPTAPKESASGCLLRIYWMMVGNALLFAAAYNIAHTESALTWIDLLFALFILCLLAARYIDIRHLRGRTSDGQPATIEDWKRYAIRATLRLGRRVAPGPRPELPLAQIDAPWGRSRTPPPAPITALL